MVTSTTLLMGVWPMERRRFFSHSGLSLTSSPVMVTPLYRLHPAFSLTSTSMGRSQFLTRNSSTEGQFTACRADEWLSRPGTVGRARPGRTLSLDDDGHLWCRVPQFARFEYWRDPERTAAIGYCFGGGIVLNMARLGSDVDGVTVDVPLSALGRLDASTFSRQVPGLRLDLPPGALTFSDVEQPLAKHGVRAETLEQLGGVTLVDGEEKAISLVPRPPGESPARQVGYSGPFRFDSWPEPGRVRLQRIRDGQLVELQRIADSTVRILKLLRGEVDLLQNDLSAEMLKDAGCRYVIVGHSERRADHGETSKMVCAKVEAAHRARRRLHVPRRAGWMRRFQRETKGNSEQYVPR